MAVLLSSSSSSPVWTISIIFVIVFIFLPYEVDCSTVEQKHAKLRQYLKNKKQGVVNGKVMPITTVIPTRTTYQNGGNEGKGPGPTPIAVQNLTPKDSVRTHNLINSGYMSKHYLDLNPNALDSGYTNYKENNIDNLALKLVNNDSFIVAIDLYPLIKNKSIKTRIINFTSIFSNRTFEKRTSYSTSKAALKALTKSLALEWSNNNITVNCISPGPFLTEINLPVLKDKKNYDEFCKKIPLKRFGNVQEILTTVLYLASDESSYVNGSEIIVDGGWTIK